MTTPRLVKNILVGVGSLYVSAPLNTSTFVPDDGSGYATPETNWTNAGFTMDGLEVVFEPDHVDIMVDQLGDAAKLVEQSTKVTIKTTLAEATLANLAIAWGYDETSTSTLSGKYTSGTDEIFNIGIFATGIPLERSLFFVGKGPGGVRRTYMTWRVIAVSSSGHSYKRGEATVFPVEFRVMPQSTRTGNEYGVITDTAVNA